MMSDHTAVKIPSIPETNMESRDFEVLVNGRRVPVYICSVSAAPLNQWWPGYQRPVAQSELASFVYWDFEGTAEVEVIPLSKRIQRAEIRPAAYGITPCISDDRITFTLDAPRHFTVEINDIHNALHVFTNPIESFDTNIGGEETLYFGAGVHRIADEIELKSGQTVYIEAGAVVYASFYAKNAENIRILGRGIINNSVFPRPQSSLFEPGSHTCCIHLEHCRNVLIDGVICQDPAYWAITPNHCENVTIRNVKIIGLWRYNADGIDICNCRNTIVEKCFLRTFDDSIVIKGTPIMEDGWRRSPENHILAALKPRNVEGVYINECVVWCDWGRALEIGLETWADEMKNMTFENTHIIHCMADVSLDINCSGRAQISNLRYENITVQSDDLNLRPKLQGQEGERYAVNPNDNFVARLFLLVIHRYFKPEYGQVGNIRNVLFKNIRYTGRWLPKSAALGYDAAHTVEDVRFEDIYVNGEKMETLEALHFEKNEFAKNITLR